MTCAGAILTGCSSRPVEKVAAPPGDRVAPAARAVPLGAPAERANTPAVESAQGIEQVPDAAIATAMRRQLALVTPVPAASSAVDVLVHNGVVVLTGSVPTGAHSRRAVRTAQLVRGVRSVIDRLEIAPAALSDSEIETRIRARFVEDPAVEEFEIAPHSRGGRVQLEGVVHSPTERELAGELAWSVPGVRAVENDITVVTRAPRLDPDIRADALAVLSRDIYLSDDTIQVGVEDGILALAGTVRSPLEKQRARMLAAVSGVRAIDAEALCVVPSSSNGAERPAPPEVPDERVADAVRDALELDPRVPEEAIAVDVENNVVTLAGNAPSSASKSAAEQDAANTVGVWRVESRIAVARREVLSDAALVSRVRKRLVENRDLDARRVTLEADDGVVVLRGKAASALERQLISRTVESTAGVRRVVNELELPQAPTRAPGKHD